MNELPSNPTESEKIPRWHFTMLRDAERNAAIESCIASLDVRDKIVVEIGSGAGLPAMLFAKYGAKHVFTCEMDERIADIARTVIKRNVLHDRISVIPKPSWKAIADQDLSVTPDIIFTETLDCGVVGEGFEPIACDIRAIASPDTIVLPGQVQQFGFLCYDLQASEKNSVFFQNGLDLSSLNGLAERNYISINQLLHDPKPLSSTFLVRNYSYLDPDCLLTVDRELVASDSGVCHGMTSYFHAHFGNFIVASSSPKSHWAMAFHPLREPKVLSAGHRYRLSVDKAGGVDLTPVLA